MPCFPVDGDLAVMNGENRDVDRIDEVAGDASRHRLRAASRESTSAGNRTDLCLGAGGNLGDRTA